MIRGQSPVEVYSNGDDRPAVAALTTLEQVRWTLARVLGQEEVRPLWPVRVVMIAPARGSQPPAAPALRPSRDLYVAGVNARDGLPPQVLRDFTLLLLESETRRLPKEIEDGLVEVFATASAEATRLTLSPPEKDRQTRDWARMYLLAVTPEYAGRVRVFFSNIQSGAGYEVAYKNAFQSTQKAMEAKVDEYFRAGQFGAETLSGMPLNPTRDIRKRDLDDSQAALALADLQSGEDRRKAFLAIVNAADGSTEALEGAGLLEEAVEAGTRSATAWFAAGMALRETDTPKAIEWLAQAAELNPRWAEPHARIAELEEQLERVIPRWRKAVELDPRNARYWEELADSQQRGRLYEEAAQSWRTAEMAAATEVERERIRERRLAYERRRLELEAAEARRQEEEKARELESLKQEALARIRAAEAKASEGKESIDSSKVVEWWDGPRPEGKAVGTLEAVECVKGQARLVVRGSDGKTLKYLVKDPGKVVLMGGGELSLGCGPQKPPRRVTVEFAPRKDAAHGTAGDVALVEFQ
jgi:hypothetical protein